MKDSRRTALVCGAAGFIGGHLVRRLKAEGFVVRAVDIRRPRWGGLAADEFLLADLRDPARVAAVLDQRFDEIYQLAADMGGAGYIFGGLSDADIMRNSSLINLNMAETAARVGVGALFYSSSACVYASHLQNDEHTPGLAENEAYPANPDSEYGWEKLFSERLYLSYRRNRALNVRIARFHNVFGPEGTWHGGKEKAPAAICRKVAAAPTGGEIEIWGDGEQRRSFLFVDECIDGIRRLMDTDCAEPLNIGSEESVSINEMAAMVIEISGKRIKLRHVPGPQGVRGRNSDNRLIRAKLGWAPSRPLREGLRSTYGWIAGQFAAGRRPEVVLTGAP